MSSDLTVTHQTERRIAFAQAQKTILNKASVQKNVNFSAISVTEQRCAAPILKVERHISVRFCATL